MEYEFCILNAKYVKGKILSSVFCSLPELGVSGFHRNDDFLEIIHIDGKEEMKGALGMAGDFLIQSRIL
jgi:hypothetical protein